MSETTDHAPGHYEPGTHPDLPPPPGTVGLVGWLRRNLFSSIVNSILTVGTIVFLVWLIPTILNWAVFSATTWGDDRSFCKLSRQVSLIASGAGAIDYQAMSVPGTDPASTATKRASVKSLLDSTRQVLGLFAPGLAQNARPAQTSLQDAKILQVHVPAAEHQYSFTL